MGLTELGKTMLNQKCELMERIQQTSIFSPSLSVRFKVAHLKLLVEVGKNTSS